MAGKSIPYQDDLPKNKESDNGLQTGSLNHKPFKVYCQVNTISLQIVWVYILYFVLF